MVFLAPLALDVLRSIGPRRPDEPIFGVASTRFRTNDSRLMRRIRRATEKREGEGKSAKVTVPGIDFTLHDLRRTCASGCAKTGADLSTISRVLGHRAFSGVLPVTVQYVSHGYASETRMAVERWARHIEGLLGIECEDDKVVPMRRVAAARALTRSASDHG